MSDEAEDTVFVSYKILNDVIELYTLDDDIHRPTKVYVFNGQYVITEETYREYLSVIKKMQRDYGDFIYCYKTDEELFDNMTFKKRITHR